MTDLPFGRGRPDRALPELRHPDALGDLSRALRRLRLHPALLRGCPLQLTACRRNEVSGSSYRTDRYPMSSGGQVLMI